MKISTRSITDWEKYLYRTPDYLQNSLTVRLSYFTDLGLNSSNNYEIVIVICFVIFIYSNRSITVQNL